MFVCFFCNQFHFACHRLCLCVCFFFQRNRQIYALHHRLVTPSIMEHLFSFLFFCRKQKTQAENAKRNFSSGVFFLFRLVLRTLLSVLSLVVSLQESRLRHTYVHLFLIVQSSGPNGDLFRYHDDEAIPDREKERERERDRKREKER